MAATYYVDLSAGTNGSGTIGSPFNSDAAMRSSGAVGGDQFIVKGTKSGTLDLGTLAGTSLAKPISVIGVTDFSTLDRSARVVINASGQSAALTGSGSNIVIENFEFKNSTGQTDQSSGSNVQFNGCLFTKGTGSATTLWSGYDRFYRGCEISGYSGTALTIAGTYGAVVEDCKFTTVGKAIDSYGYRNLTVRRNSIASTTSDAITLVDNATVATTYEIVDNSFGTIGGHAIVIGGNGNGDVMVKGCVFGAVTGTGIRITAGSPSGTTVGAFNNRFWTVGTNIGSTVNDLGLNITLGSNPFTNAASDLTPASGSPLIGAGYNGGSFGAMQAASGGSTATSTLRGARLFMERSLGETAVFDFTTEGTSGLADADSTPTCEVFADTTDTALLTPTVTKRTGKTGNYRVTVAMTSGNGFSVGPTYNIHALATIGGVNKKIPIANFTLRTGTVDAANVTKVSGDTTSATNLKNALNGTGGVTFSGNLSGSVGSVTGAVGSVTGAVGSVTGGVGGNVSGSVASVVGNVGGNVVGSVASVTGSVGSVTGAVGSVTGNVGGNLSGNVLGSVSGSVGSVTGAVGSVTGSVGSVAGNVVGSVASVTGAVGSVSGSVSGDVQGKVLGGGASSITGDGVRASSVTGSVGSVTGSVGSVLGSVASVTGAVGSVTSVSNIATTVRDIDNTSPAVNSLGAKVNSAASAGDPMATNVPGSYAPGTAGYIIGTNLNATITSRHASGAAVASVTGSVGSVTGSVGSVVGSVGSVAGNVAGNVVGSVASVSGNVAGSVASVVGNVGGNVAGTVASVVGSVGSVIGSVGSVVGSVASVTGSVGSVTAGVVLAANGLNNVDTTAPTGPAANYREQQVMLYRRFFKKSTMTASAFTFFADNGTTVICVQPLSDDGTTQTVGAAA